MSSRGAYEREHHAEEEKDRRTKVERLQEGEGKRREGERVGGVSQDHEPITRDCAQLLFSSFSAHSPTSSTHSSLSHPPASAAVASSSASPQLIPPSLSIPPCILP